MLGVDLLGRDLLSRIIWGSRTVLIVAPLAVLSAYVVGLFLGMLAGYFQRWVDTIITRVNDLILAFPAMILYVLLIALIGPSVTNIVIGVTIAHAPSIARMTRGLTLEIKALDFVAAAKVRGEHFLYILLVEILPNMRWTLLTAIALRLGYTTVMLGTLGFLGLGLPPPRPDWGGMAREAAPLILAYPHMAVVPCLAIASLVLGFNLLADGLREVKGGSAK